MTNKEIRQRLGCAPDHPENSPINVFAYEIARLVAEACRQALNDAADDFESGASAGDIRANAERLE